MKVNKIDHICIAVKNLDEARKIWEPALGKSKPNDEYIDEPENLSKKEAKGSCSSASTLIIPVKLWKN